jgi:NAD-dependent deacetylase sirtuin 1
VVESEAEEGEEKRYGTDGYVRYKIPEISGSTDPRIALNLIKQAKKIVIVSGAGISVSAGIPDFRSEGRGLYALLASFLSGERSAEAIKFFGGLKGWQLDALQRLDEPESLFDLEFFLADPHPFYAFLMATRFGAPSAARFEPTPSHHVISALPNLLLAFTQNIDTLEAVAGITRVCYCHGSFESVSCVKCRRPHDVEYFWKLVEMYGECDAMEEGVSYLPICQYCTNESFDNCSSSDDDNDNVIPLLKPDIVFFGESLPANFFAHIRSTLPACDLLIVTGSSMKVLPVASIPDLIPPTVPQILINKDRILDHNFDLELLGEADRIWSWIGSELNLKGQQNNQQSNQQIEIKYADDGKFLF